ncbi:Membrane-associated tyrosine- and threonine-specific cdc2-inhibitory kinase [Nymphon striatum]|nr:Membrane-associated tyrosine- and threonine-specific cdc2-inhibitory kinase [Nymphon striatum]
MALRKPLPAPNPKFFSEECSFSTKKENATPRTCVPPPLPYKSAPPARSRVFRKQVVQRAQAVSFRDSDCFSAISSQHYNESSEELYFDQCFRVESKIGEGSFGEVFKVRSIDDRKVYAVKRSLQKFRGDWDRRRKLEEVQKLEQLPKHPNCIKFIKAWHEHEQLYIQTELCETSLSDFCERNHNISECMVWKYTAINHLHSHKLIHLDIKPANIFISMDGICKLGDFGLVYDMNTGNLSEAQEGDPKYLAPELMRGCFTKAADVFSLGITILELATDLEIPKEGALWQKLRSGYIPFDSNRALSSDLKYLIQQMLNPNYQERITAKQCLELPAVQKTNGFKSRFFAIFLFFATWFIFLREYISKIFRKSSDIKTPPPPSSTYPRHPSEWDRSYSEDEIFNESIVSANNMDGNSFFNSSVFSDGQNESMYFDRPPKRFAFSTPAARRDRSSFANESSHIAPNHRSSPLGVDKSPISINGSHYLYNSSLQNSTQFSHSDYDSDQVIYSRPITCPKNLMKEFDEVN